MLDSIVKYLPVIARACQTGSRRWVHSELQGPGHWSVAEMLPGRLGEVELLVVSSTSTAGYKATQGSLLPLLAASYEYRSLDTNGLLTKL